MDKFETIIVREKRESLRPSSVSGIRHLKRNKKIVYGDVTGKIIVYTDGVKSRHYTICNGILQSFNDEPAVWTNYGNYLWFHKGIIHRETGPAIFHTSGSCIFYMNNEKITLNEFIVKSSISDEQKIELVLKYG